MLIIPGLIKFVRFQFVNFIICTSKKYEQGEVDALESSEKMSKGYLWGLLFLFLFFTILSMAATSNYLLSERPFLVLSVELINLILMTFEMIYIYFVFDDILTKGRAWLDYLTPVSEDSPS